MIRLGGRGLRLLIHMGLGGSCFLKGGGRWVPAVVSGRLNVGILAHLSDHVNSLEPDVTKYNVTD